MSRRVVIVILAALSGLVVSSSLSRAKGLYPKTYQEMDRIVASTELTRQEKIAKLKGYFGKEPYWPAVLYRIARVDKAAAQAAALELFRRKGTSREHGLQLGRVLLTQYKAPGFIDEYAPFLVNAVLVGGEKEFCVKRERKISAVGEYAFIASGFEGHSPGHFEKIKDKRVIPVLIKWLDAPDNVWGGRDGCMAGKAGESTGRNVQRQQIPVALAKLGAVQAVGPLKRHLMTHRDYWLRYHSARALAVLMDRKDSRALEAKLKGSKDLARFLFAFGTGLIEQGDDNGVEYMAFRYSIYDGRKDISSVLYMMEQRLKILKGSRSRRAEGFYRQALEYPPLRNILLFDDGKVAFGKSLTKRDEDGKLRDIASAGEALAQAAPRIIRIYRDVVAQIRANDLRALAPTISRIAGRTREPAIRKISEKYLAEIGK
ncbi:MAG: hypothetical protein ACYSU0_13035 [Planctomycetota bacterium]